MLKLVISVMNNGMYDVPANCWQSGLTLSYPK